MRLYYYDDNGVELGYGSVETSDAGTISSTWAQKGGSVTTPAGTDHVRIKLGTQMMSGWITFDDVTLSSIIQRTTYAMAGQAIAVEVTGDPEAANNGLFYLHSDHLGSANAMSYGAGHATGTEGTLVGVVNQFYPFGEYRTGDQSDIADYGFTGHKENRDIGLTYMNARFYVPGLGRFATADIVVPDLANPQMLNPSTYVLNHPLRLFDPSGHCGADPDPRVTEYCTDLRDNLQSQYETTIMGEWTYQEMLTIQLTFGDLESGLGGLEAFLFYYSGMEIERHRRPKINPDKTD